MALIYNPDTSPKLGLVEKKSGHKSYAGLPIVLSVPKSNMSVEEKSPGAVG